MNKVVDIVFETAKEAKPVTATLKFKDPITELPAIDELANGKYELHIVDGVVTWVLTPAFPTANGDYKLHIVDGVATWVLLPELPTADGDYHLHIAEGVATWVVVAE